MKIPVGLRPPFIFIKESTILTRRTNTPTLSGSIFGDGSDTSSTVTWTENNDSWSPSPMTNLISCHEPHDTSKASSQEVTFQNPYRCEEDDTIKVVDTFSNIFPVLWVQERFTTPIPANFIWNGSTKPPFHWTTGLDGIFATDHLGWTFSDPPGPIVTLVHDYWGATTNILTGGTDAGAWTITFTPPTQTSNASATQTHN